MNVNKDIENELEIVWKYSQDIFAYLASYSCGR